MRRDPDQPENTSRKRARAPAAGDLSTSKRARWGVLTSQGSWADRSPLHEGACQGRLLVLKTLLSQGYSANAETMDHVTPLHEACLGGHVACARALIEAGARVGVSSIDGVTPLFNACWTGSVSCAELLLESGARPQCGACQPSPLHQASAKGRAACVEVLVAWGADPDYDITHLGTPLYVACVGRELMCARKLLDAGADVQKGRSLATPLHAAAERNSAELVRLLLEFGADVTARNLELRRPVETAPPGGPAERVLRLYQATPRSLCQLCRLRVRSCLSRSRLHLIPQLTIPTLLQNFLLHR